MSREIGSTLKPIFVDENGAAKPCELPKNATQLGTNENGEIIAVSTATSGGTTVCYLSPDEQYWLWKTGKDKTEIKTKTIVDKFLKEKDATARYVEFTDSNGVTKEYYIGYDDDEQLMRQLTAEDKNRKYFPLFTLTMASEFINRFRITSRGQNFKIDCTEGIYLYENVGSSQVICHPDVQGGGASTIVVEGKTNNSWHVNNGNVSDNVNKPFAFCNDTVLVDGENKPIIERPFGVSEDGKNTPYTVTFMTPLIERYRGLVKIYGKVEFRCINFTFGNYSKSESTYYADNITYDKYNGKMQSPFITNDQDDGSEIKFTAVWLNTGIYACYNISSIVFGYKEYARVDGTNDKTIASVPKYIYPTQINSALITPMFGAYRQILINTNVYLRVISRHTITKDNNYNSTDFKPIFALLPGCKLSFSMARSNPTRIEVDCKQYYYDNKGEGVGDTTPNGGVIQCLIIAQYGTGFVFNTSTTSANDKIVDTNDSVAIYWHATCDDGAGNQTYRKQAHAATDSWEIDDCIPLIITASSMHVDYAVWTDSEHANINGFFNDGRIRLNRWIHFKKWLTDSNEIADLGADFETSGDHVGRRIEDSAIEGSGHFSGSIFIHNQTHNF